MTEKFRDAVIVPCHAGFVGQSQEETMLAASYRGLFGSPPYYNAETEIQLYIDHIKAGCEYAGRRSEALLIFSGGCTRPDFDVADTEATGYYRIAEAHKWWDIDLCGRVALEQFAAGSFEKLRNSVRYFEDLTKRPPVTVTVLGFGFKQARFQFHAKTIKRRRPFEFKYLCVNDPPVPVLADSIKGEKRTLSELSNSREAKAESYSRNAVNASRKDG